MGLDHFIQHYVANSTQHRCFYHFTDRSNIESIKARHLLSMRNARAMGFQVPAPGGNQLSLDEDRRRGMDAYVHLSMTTSHPMAYVAQQDGRIKNIVWIRVNPHVIKLPGVMLTDVVSNSSGCVPFPASEIERLDLQVIYTRTDWKDPSVHTRLKSAEKYEILVPNYIHLDNLRIP